MVVFDLDGLVLDTETLCTSVAAEVLGKRGVALTAAAHSAALGRTPSDAWAAVAEAAGLAAAAGPELLAESEPLLRARWGEARPMPGALRLLRHLASLGVPVAVATSTPRASFERKLAGKCELRGLLTRCGASVACGDEVERGKPAPDVFELAVAKLLLWRQRQQQQGPEAAAAAPGEGDDGDDDGGARRLAEARALLPRAREALAQGRVAVFEDAPSGVEGALAAGARVVVVPSLRDRGAYPSSPSVAADVPSLLAFDPRCLGLAPFDDLVPSSSLPSPPPAAAAADDGAAAARPGPPRPRGAVPLDPPIRIAGSVVRGFGRGSRELGIPTANVDPDVLIAALAEAVTGVYVGWACVVTRRDGEPGGDGEGGSGGALVPRLAASGGGVGGEEGPGHPGGRDGLPPGVYPTAVSCGYNPQFANAARTLEPWVLADYGPGVEFYGEEIRLVIVGYLRPEAAFVSVPALVEQIHADARDARRALADARFARFAGDAFLTAGTGGGA
jgi:riboflavin kinase